MSAENEGRMRDVLALLKDSMDAEKRVALIERRIANGYKADNGAVHGRYLEYVDIATMLADLRWLADEWTRARALADALDPDTTARSERAEVA